MTVLQSASLPSHYAAKELNEQLNGMTLQLVCRSSINLTNRSKTLSCVSIETLSMFVICCHFLGSKAIITTTVC